MEVDQITQGLALSEESNNNRNNNRPQRRRRPNNRNRNRNRNNNQSGENKSQQKKAGHKSGQGRSQGNRPNKSNHSTSGAQNNRNKKRPNNNRRSNRSKPMTPARVILKYDNLLEQHLVARRKYFEMHGRSEGRQKEKLEKNFYKTLDDLRFFEMGLKDWQKEALEKKTEAYP